MTGRLERVRPAAPLAAAFAAVHAWLTVLGVVVVPGAAFYDLELYRWWAWLAQTDGPLAVLAEGWVYPAGALVPILAAAVGGTGSTAGYALSWCALVAALDAVAVVALVRGGRRTGAWWWLGFLALLGPVSIGRLDAVVAPLCVTALVLVSRSPVHARAASALVAAGAWIKVAPGALLLPLLAARRRPLREVVLPGAIVSLVVVAPVVALGGAGHLLGFLTDQGGRGLQIEAVGASAWMVARLLTRSVTVAFDAELSTYEITGPGTLLAARVLDIALLAAVVAIGLALLLARRRGVGELTLLPASLAVMVALIATDKVGSPQYLTWVAAPIAVALAYPAALRTGVATMPAADLAPQEPAPDGGYPAWLRAAAGVALVTAAITQAIFPWGYTPLVLGNAAMTALLVVRNVLILVLLGCALVGVRAVLRWDPDVADRRPGAVWPGRAVRASRLRRRGALSRSGA